MAPSWKKACAVKGGRVNMLNPCGRNITVGRMAQVKVWVGTGLTVSALAFLVLGGRA